MFQDSSFPPLGFERLTIEEQVEYAEALKEFISNQLKVSPIPEWHREVLAERLANLTDSNDEFMTWDEFELELNDTKK